MDNTSGIINKIKNIFKPKPKTYLLGDGKTLEINGSISNPRNPISNLFNSIGTALVDFTSRIKKYIDDSKIKNQPTIHSTSLVELNTKPAPKKAPNLLAQGNIENAPIIPHNVKTIPTVVPIQTNSEVPKEPRVYTATMSFRGSRISDSIEIHAAESMDIIKTYRGTLIKDPQRENQMEYTENKEK